MTIKLYETNYASLNLPPDYNCFICLDTENDRNTNWVFHEGEGDKHPVHKECIKWYTHKKECAACRVAIDSTSITKWFSLKYIFSQVLSESITYPAKVFAWALIGAKGYDFMWCKLFNIVCPFRDPYISFCISIITVGELGNTMKQDNFYDISVFLVSRIVGAVVVPILFNMSVTGNWQYADNSMMLGALCGGLVAVMNMCRNVFAKT